MSGVSFQRGTSIVDGYAPYTLSQSAVPFIMPSSGSMGNNGALTMTTALPNAYLGGGFIYLPANAISVGSAAGWYWYVGTTTTTGTVYNNTYTSGPVKQSIPSTPTAFVTTGPGAYTQSTSVTADFDGPKITVPANSIGANGSLELYSLFTVPNNANTKPVAIKESGSTLSTSSGLASVAGQKFWWTFENRNNPAINLGQSGVGALVSGNSSLFFTRNTALDTVWNFSFALGTATDYIVLESFEVQVKFSA